MDRNEIIENLQDIFRDVFDDDDIVLTDNLSAQDIEQWDSLSHITMIYEVQSEFGIKFSSKEIMSLTNVGDLINMISEKAN